MVCTLLVPSPCFSPVHSKPVSFSEANTCVGSVFTLIDLIYTSAVNLLICGCFNTHTTHTRVCVPAHTYIYMEQILFLLAVEHGISIISWCSELKPSYELSCCLPCVNDIVLSCLLMSQMPRSGSLLNVLNGEKDLEVLYKTICYNGCRWRNYPLNCLTTLEHL